MALNVPCIIYIFHIGLLGMMVSPLLEWVVSESYEMFYF